MKDWISRNRWIGAVLLVGGLVAVVMIRRGHPEVEEIKAIRPLKTLVLGMETSTLVEEYPAKVAAGQEVVMAFERGGTLMELPVKESDRVKKGQLLAKLDPRDARNQLDAAEAELKRAEAQRDRMRIAAAAKAVSQQELSNAEASYEVAAAQRNIKQKALEDTDLKASFDGVIARVLVKNFETVQPKQQILSLQDLSDVEIIASIPEARIANLRPRAGEERTPRFRFSVVFDFLPERAFDLTFKEFAVEADALTQTFTAKFRMPSPTDVSILPGMACTVKVQPMTDEGQAETRGFEIPLDAVPVDGVGQFFVWLVREAEAGLFQVERRDVKVGPLGARYVLVTDGLAKGDRIALAGVHVLREGTVVRLQEPKEPAAP
jgi:RND family efflux transporter MFP subunit